MNIFHCRFVTDQENERIEIIAENERIAAEIFVSKAFMRRGLWHKLSGEHTKLSKEYNVEVTPDGKLTGTIFSILVKSLYCFYAKEKYDEYV